MNRAFITITAWSLFPRLFNDLLILHAILILLVEIYRILREVRLGYLLSQKRKDRRELKPIVLRPKRERDSRFCQEGKRTHKMPEREEPLPGQSGKGKGRPKKKVSTERYFCPNESCEYYGISEEQTHALVDMVGMECKQRTGTSNTRRVGRSFLPDGTLYQTG